MASDGKEEIENESQSEQQPDEQNESVSEVRSGEQMENVSSKYDLDIPRSRKKNFLVELFSIIEDFKRDKFKEQQEERKGKRKEKKDKEKALKDSSTTKEDLQKDRQKVIQRILIKALIVVFIVGLVTGAIILATQENEQMARRTIDSNSMLNDTTSFGKIDEKDYFLEQNILDEKINIVEKSASADREAIRNNLNQQTEKIIKHIDEKVGTLKESQKDDIKTLKEELSSEFDEKITLVKADQVKSMNQVESRLKQIKQKPGLKLKDGKIVFPAKGEKVPNLSNSDADSGYVDVPSEEDKLYSSVDGAEDIIEYAETDLSTYTVPTMNFDTGMQSVDQNKTESNIEFDLTTTLVRVTLINGIKAPTLDIGVKNPTPVLMSVDGVAYAANDNTRGILKGCLLRGIAVGNINTSRAEIFGTHLSCILEKYSGKKYKIEHTFPDNEVWIKGEDGADGVAGLIVDSSGKVLSKSAAIGFMQGLTNYFSAQNLVTGGMGGMGAVGGMGTTGRDVSTGAMLGTSMRSGVGTGLSTGFNLIIRKYEEILGGYYPFIDVKGGRKNLTAIFGGGVKLKGTPYMQPNLDDLEDDEYDY